MLIREYALLHFDVDDEPERAKREVEAEAVAYIVGRYFGLDTSGSAFYFVAQQDDEADAIQDRLCHISSTAVESSKLSTGSEIRSRVYSEGE